MKSTIQQYGWIVITVIIIAILIGISAPAAMYLRDNVVGVVGGFGDLMSGDNSSGDDEGGSGDDSEPVGGPGLYQTGSNYTVLITSWEELVSSGAIVVNNGVVYRGTVMPDLPEKNEYGFYYGVQYVISDYGYVFNEDGSIEFYDAGYPDGSMPAGSAVYGPYSITVSEWNIVISVSADGTELTDGYDPMAISEMPAQLPGDLMLPTDGSITQLGDLRFDSSIGKYGDYVGNAAFAGCTTLTDVKIPDSVTSIGKGAFDSCTNLTTITFEGTVEQWYAITFGGDWHYDVPATEVICSNGTVSLVGNEE